MAQRQFHNRVDGLGGIAAIDPTNPQSWNRYAYVLNNPLAMVDPTGMDGGCGELGSGDDGSGDSGGGGEQDAARRAHRMDLAGGAHVER
jgi:hypothetical protein